jgi:hypothetical protein
VVGEVDGLDLVVVADSYGDEFEDVDVGGVDLAEEGGLDARAIAAEEIEQLQGHDGVHDDLAAEVAEVDYLLTHALVDSNITIPTSN